MIPPRMRPPPLQRKIYCSGQLCFNSTIFSFTGGAAGRGPRRRRAGSMPLPPYSRQRRIHLSRAARLIPSSSQTRDTGYCSSTHNCAARLLNRWDTGCAAPHGGFSFSFLSHLATLLSLFLLSSPIRSITMFPSTRAQKSVIRANARIVSHGKTVKPWM